MSLNGAIGLEVSKTNYFVFEVRHDRNDAQSREHSMSAISIRNVGRPVLRRTKAEFRAEVSLFVLSHSDGTIRTLSIAPRRATPGLNTGFSGLTSDDFDSLALWSGAVAGRHVPVHPRPQRRAENPPRQVRRRASLHAEPPFGARERQPGRQVS